MWSDIFSTAHSHYFCLSVCQLIILNTLALIYSTVISHAVVQPTIKIHSNRGLLIFSVFYGRNYSRPIFLKFTSLTYQFVSHINPDIFGKWQDISLKFLNMLRNHLRTYVSEALHVSPLLRLGTFSWIVTRYSHQKMSQFSTLVAAHQAEVRGPLVENRWLRVCLIWTFSLHAYVAFVR